MKPIADSPILKPRFPMDITAILRNAFENLPCFYLDARHRITCWNRACEEFTGIPEKEMLGTRNAWQAFSEKPCKVLADYLLDGASPDPDYPYISLNQNAIVQLRQTAPGLDNKREVWSLALLDTGGGCNPAGALEIFAPVSATDILLHSTLVQTFIEKFPVPVSLVVDGRYYAVNQLLAELLEEKSSADVIGKTTDTYLDESDRPRFMAANANGFAGLNSGGVYHWKYKIKGKERYLEGQPTIFEWGAKKALLSIVHDITALKRKEQAMARQNSQLRKENAQLLARQMENEGVFFGTGEKLSRTLDLALQMGKTDSNLVILGETGTGKSFLARFIHNISDRRKRPFVMVNCAAIPEALFESQFFGHVKGAFTGADKNHAGFLACAHEGTLFLDEVGELSPVMQAKLLHALEQGCFVPVGSSAPQTTNVRIICATNRDIAAMLKSGLLREDFFYRIFVMALPIPPLRECREDLPDFIRHFFKKLNPFDGAREIPESVIEKLMEHSWPGNVRELQNTILRYLATGQISFLSGQKNPLQPAASPSLGESSLEEILEKTERETIIAALRSCGFNKMAAAEKLKVNLRTFHRRCAKLGIIRQTVWMPDEA